jgi:lipoprotein-releasing system permease protein
LNTEFFISKRITSKSQSDSFSRPAVRIAIISITLGIAVMIIAVSIVTGFKKQISEKVIGFGSHIQITNYDANASLEAKPIEKNQSFYPSMNNAEGIRHIQVFANKAGIIKTDNDIQGVILKGIGSDFDWDFFKDKIVSGKSFVVKDCTKTNDILISKIIAQKLKLKVGDDFIMHFIQDPPRMRKFKITGIYETGMEEFDKLYVIGDIFHVQKLNDWTPNQVAGFEVLIKDFNKLDEMAAYVYENIGYNLNSKSIKELYPQIFDWLKLQDMNVYIILILMVLVAGINMISTLLILILERTNMIGILKALGAKNWSIRKIFLYNAAYLIGRGLIWGNIIGIALCLLQLTTGIIKLPQESYYVSVVPINLNIFHILLINFGSLIICLLMLIIPSYIVTKITPVKAIRFS